MKLYKGLIAKLYLFLQVLDSVSAASATSGELGVFDPIVILATTGKLLTLITVFVTTPSTAQRSSKNAAIVAF